MFESTSFSSCRPRWPFQNTRSPGCLISFISFCRNSKNSISSFPIHRISVQSFDHFSRKWCFSLLFHQAYAAAEKIAEIKFKISFAGLRSHTLTHLREKFLPFWYKTRCLCSRISSQVSGLFRNFLVSDQTIRQFWMIIADLLSDTTVVPRHVRFSIKVGDNNTFRRSLVLFQQSAWRNMTPKQWKFLNDDTVYD
jgi:hypothetical protein